MPSPHGNPHYLNQRAAAPQFDSGQDCSDCLMRLRKAASEGPHERRPNMDKFIRRQNVERCRCLLERVTEESHRRTIIKLLTEEQQKQKDAGDPVW